MSAAEPSSSMFSTRLQFLCLSCSASSSAACSTGGETWGGAEQLRVGAHVVADSEAEEATGEEREGGEGHSHMLKLGMIVEVPVAGKRQEGWPCLREQRNPETIIWDGGSLERWGV